MNQPLPESVDANFRCEPVKSMGLNIPMTCALGLTHLLGRANARAGNEFHAVVLLFDCESSKTFISSTMCPADTQSALIHFGLGPAPAESIQRDDPNPTSSI